MDIGASCLFFAASALLGHVLTRRPRSQQSARAATALDVRQAAEGDLTVPRSPDAPQRLFRLGKQDRWVSLRWARPDDCDEVLRMIIELATFEGCPGEVHIDAAKLRRDGLGRVGGGPGQIEVLIVEVHRQGR